MKTKIITLLALVLLLNSCIVKSLHPFYTKNTISFEQRFIGNWEDNKKGKWEILSFKDELLKDSKVTKASELSKEDLAAYNQYKDGYIVNYTEKDKKSIFLAIPFIINNQLFIDFTPLDFDIEQLNDLASLHLLPTHSLVKFDIINDDMISIKWFDQSKISELLESNKIKIKYEKVGIDDTYLLTASSEELEKFIAKYMSSKDENKWKTDIKFNLQRVDATE